MLRLCETLNEDDYALITEEEGCELHFRIVELRGEIKELLT